MSHMLCYLWYEKGNPNECKFGERWVERTLLSQEEAEEEIWKRIKESVGVRKDLIRSGEIVLESFWDVSEYAQKHDRFYKGARVDDHIRPAIGHRKGSTGEIHSIDAVTAAYKVNQHLIKHDQPLPEAGLATLQYKTLVNVLNAISAGCCRILAELCARFGKTIWAGALGIEMDAQVIIVASYVLTSFTSFKKDLSNFNQFRNIVHVDLEEDGWQDKILRAINDGKKVIVYLSMCQGSQRPKKLQFLKELCMKKLWIIDEGDFGVHKEGQVRPLIEAVSDDVAVIMTGTNGDRAASEWGIDHYVPVTYPELLMEKRS